MTAQAANMAYKMLVLDLDDTLLREDYSISDRNLDALTKAQEQGVKVVLASGRPTEAMYQFSELLQLDKYDSYIISYNGARITSMQNRDILFENSLSKEQIHSLYDFSVANKLHIITFSEKGVISETQSPYIDNEIRLTGMPHCLVPSFKDEVQFSAVKCILLEDPIYLKEMEAKLKEECPEFSVSISKPFYLEVVQNGIDKALSIDFLAKKLGIQNHEIIAVGNAGNDLSMIQYAGLGVWVNNVPDHLRHYADIIVSSNEDDGVAEVVEKYILS
jgi:Cof subfamily protein (haloacid dehalogenase superfamily)